MSDSAIQPIGAPGNCRNCDAALVDGQAFCGQCGQKAVTHRLTLVGIGHDLVHALFHIDQSILALLKGLLLRPGHVAREYVQGRRRKYFSPFAFAVITAGLATFFVIATGARWFSPITDSEAQGILSRHINLVILLQAPVLTSLCWLLFWNARMTFAEHLVLVAYTAGIRMLYLSFVAAPVMYATGVTSANPWFIAGYYGPWLVYFAIASVQFYPGRAWATVLKAVVATTVNQVLTMVGIYAFILTYERVSH